MNQVKEKRHRDEEALSALLTTEAQWPRSKALQTTLQWIGRLLIGAFVGFLAMVVVVMILKRGDMHVPPAGVRDVICVLALVAGTLAYARWDWWRQRAIDDRLRANPGLVRSRKMKTTLGIGYVSLALGMCSILLVIVSLPKTLAASGHAWEMARGLMKTWPALLGASFFLVCGRAVIHNAKSQALAARNPSDDIRCNPGSAELTRAPATSADKDRGGDP